MSKNKSYFEGWYFKQQNESDTCILIPGFHRSRRGEEKAFLQIVVKGKSYYLDYPIEQFHYQQNPFMVRVGENQFTPDGITISINREELRLSGEFKFSSWKEIRYPIMGPFEKLPFMECGHGILSMDHQVSGHLLLDGEKIAFSNGRGYIEKDKGKSFPKSYQWVQCNCFTGELCSVMAAVAHIPFLGFAFKGCIAIVCYGGREYRFATYLGARIIHQQEDSLMIKQGKYTLFIRLKCDGGRQLKAPVCGEMGRMITEEVDCIAQIRMVCAGRKMFDRKSNRAAYEIVEE